MKEVRISCEGGFHVRDKRLMPKCASAELVDQLRYVLLVNFFAADS